MPAPVGSRVAGGGGVRFKGGVNCGGGAAAGGMEIDETTADGFTRIGSGPHSGAPVRTKLQLATGKSTGRMSESTAAGS